MYSHLYRYLCALLLCIWLLPQPASADEKAPDFAVQAAMMRLFTSFLQWPSNPPTINVCVYGESKIPGSALIQNLYSKPPTGGLPLSLQTIKDWKSAAKNCQVLFIDASEEAKLDEITVALKAYPVVTISNVDKFTEKGGMIEFVSEDTEGKSVVRYIVNRNHLKASGINITNPEILAKAKTIL